MEILRRLQSCLWDSEASGGGEDMGLNDLATVAIAWKRFPSLIAVVLRSQLHF